MNPTETLKKWGAFLSELPTLEDPIHILVERANKNNAVLNVEETPNGSVPHWAE